MLRQHSEQAERASRLPEASVAALRDAGLFRLGVPSGFGGFEAGLAMVLEVTSELARACPSSSWVTALSYGAQHVASAFGEQVRRELWSEGPDVAMCASLTGHRLVAARVEGGQLLSGRWPWSSGAYQAQWAALEIPVADEHGAVLDRAMALVPMGELWIENTWDMAGMRGTGSHTLVSDRVFVPDHRIRSLTAIIQGPTGPIEPPYRVPLGCLALTLVGPLLGMAQEVFDQTMRVVASGKPLAASTYTHVADSPSMQANLADAVNLIDSARLHLFRSAHQVDEAATTAAELDITTRARVRMDAGYASKCLREAVHLLLSVSGASTFSRINPVQRYWRDLETAARHPTISTELSREIYGRALVGSNDQVSYLI
ncbi:MAG TPA: acyl-CoA dehydrogenase family protein [Pseudonocardia sp.]|uniref:acyl-CoA dehydrogenase family protein n=1 Tax=Pseudonocardia sp. TaxID=60912 RepID=UPI002C8DB56F|nr:acyl-CoA dehydrogenase family protein [Pseudonocardia sp.]HTF50109.1 acyl-CoA dehydrogenase family protein [Pseudonocardia sp.]